ncbi:g12031 [Coccomyxa viridis]|uniref:G12031 protein n=1 Tax=Coccomyxa viridis TaxID=1274662 RepID=A0ABP1G9F5_9CHLO
MAQALRQRIAPLLNKVQQTVTPVYSATEKQITQQFDKMMKGGEQYVVKDKAQADKLLKQWFYTNMARIPEGLKEAKQDWGTVQSKWAQKHDMPMTEVGMYALFVGELYAWFVVGEIAGRGFTFSGYKI